MGRWKTLGLGAPRKGPIKSAAPQPPRKGGNSARPYPALDPRPYPAIAHRAFCGFAVGDIEAAIARAKREASS